MSKESRAPASRGARKERALSVMILLDEGRDTRAYTIRYKTLRWLGIGGALGAIFLLGMIVSWGYLAVRANRVGALETEVAQLSGQESQVAALAEELEAVESAYESLRGLFGSSAAPEAGDLWLPPSAGRSGASRVPDATAEAGAPSEWPLTEPGFLTRTPMEGGNEEHPGVDIAVPTGSYVRAAGTGTVTETGADGVYGNYVIVDHGEGYRSLYGHASLILATAGSEVRRDEVIALSGSSGRSTAPHLHFEISKDGVPIDPLTFVEQP